MSRADYTTVRLPSELLRMVDAIIEAGVLGYKSRAEFVKEAIRSHIVLIARVLKSLKAK